MAELIRIRISAAMIYEPAFCFRGDIEATIRAELLPQIKEAYKYTHIEIIEPRGLRPQ